MIAVEQFRAAVGIFNAKLGRGGNPGRDRFRLGRLFGTILKYMLLLCLVPLVAILQCEGFQFQGISVLSNGIVHNNAEKCLEIFTDANWSNDISRMGSMGR